ncbi:hypothetical protein [Desulfoluna butyratoxydans]|nr:hypothetical protein [Desulfoluna butyratoxydans]
MTDGKMTPPSGGNIDAPGPSLPMDATFQARGVAFFKAISHPSPTAALMS